MALDEKNNTDDFFRALGQNLNAANPPEDEIVFRDEDGKLKTLKGGVILDYGDSTDQTEEKTPIPEPATDLQPILTATPQPTPGDSKLELMADQVIVDSDLNIVADDDRKKLKAIILSRLKEVRDQVQTREALLGLTNVSGKIVDNIQADKILGLINVDLDELHGNIRTEINNEPFSDLRAEAQQILAEPELAVKPAFNPLPPKIDDEGELEPAKLVPPVAPLSSNFSINPVATRSGTPPQRIKPLVNQTAGKPKIEDVRFKPRLTGPIEEIRNMKLVDFRRLDKSPALAIEKIIGKIDLLEEESFAMRTEAIKAWKQNEINQLYISLGDQSMEERKSISDIIAERQAAGQPTLNEEEVDAVIELNKRLRY